MRRYLPVAFAGLLLALYLLFTSVPARVLPRLVAGENLQLSGVSGSLWEGRAARAFFVTPSGPLHLGTLRWRLRLASLFSLSPTVELRSEWGSQRAQALATLAGEGLRLRDLDAGFDASILESFLPFAVGGRLNLLFDELEFAAASLRSAEGRLVWQDATWRAQGDPRALGSYAATASTAEEGSVLADITTIAGPLRAEGSLSLDQSRYLLEMEISPVAGAVLDAELDRGLSLIASPMENGYLLRLDGDLPQSF